MKHLLILFCLLTSLAHAQIIPTGATYGNRPGKLADYEAYATGATLIAYKSADTTSLVSLSVVAVEIGTGTVLPVLYQPVAVRTDRLTVEARFTAQQTAWLASYYQTVSLEITPVGNDKPMLLQTLRFSRTTGPLTGGPAILVVTKPGPTGPPGPPDPTLAASLSVTNGIVAAHTTAIASTSTAAINNTAAITGLTSATALLRSDLTTTATAANSATATVVAHTATLSTHTTQLAGLTSATATLAGTVTTNTASIAANTSTLTSQSAAITANTTTIASHSAATQLTSATVVGQNLYDATAVVVGEALAGNGVPVAFGGTYTRSAYIPIVAGGLYTLSGLPNGGSFTLATVPAASAAATPTLATSPATFPYTFTAAAGSKYILFTVRLNGGPVNPFIKFEPGTTATPYTPYIANTLRATAGSTIMADVLTPGATMNGNKVVTVDQAGLPTDAWPTNYTKILFLGSSITKGFNVPDSSMFTTLVAATLTGVYGRSISVTNGGVNGSSSNDMLNRLPALLSAGSPQIVFIESSVNDAVATANAPTPATVRAQVISMVNAVRAAGAVPVIWTTPPFQFSKLSPPYGVSQQRRLAVDAVNIDVARAMGVRLISCNDLTEVDWNGDGIHPNENGSRLGIAARLVRWLFSY